MPEEPGTSLVATLPGASEAVAHPVANALKTAGATGIAVMPRATDRCVDVVFDGLDLEAAYGVARPALPSGADIIIQPAATRRKKLLIADMESTVIEQEMLDELAAMLGIHDRVAHITARAMNGELDFAASLTERAALLAGQPSSLLDEASRRITLMPGARDLVAAMKAHGGVCWLVTGGFDVFAEPVGRALGFDRVLANRLQIEAGRITGRVAPPILDRDSKRVAMMEASARHGVPLTDVLAIGDGANDLPMLTACTDGGGLGVAFHAKPSVRAAARHRLDHADLTALIAAQGARTP